MNVLCRLLPLVFLAIVAGCHSVSVLTVKEVEVKGATLRYLDQGQGQPVIFVHGALSDHRVWENQRDPIARNFRFIALDQRFFGTAPWPADRSRYSIDCHAEDLATFIQGLNVGPVHVVGWSYGGAVALEAGIRYPQLVKSLFLYEPSPILSAVTDTEGLNGIAEDRKGLGPALAAYKANDLPGAAGRFAEWVFKQKDGEFSKRNPKWAQTAVLDNARTLPLLFASPPPKITCEQLGTLKARTALVVGAETRPYFRIQNETARRCLPHGLTYVAIPNANHDAPYSNPRTFNEELRRFLGAN